MDGSGDLTRAFQRLIEEEGFAARVVSDPGKALAGYDLSDEEVDALTADAAALEDEVAGFVQRVSFAQILSIGGLQTPRLIGGAPRLSFRAHITDT